MQPLWIQHMNGMQSVITLGWVYALCMHKTIHQVNSGAQGFADQLDCSLFYQHTKQPLGTPELRKCMAL